MILEAVLYQNEKILIASNWYPAWLIMTVICLVIGLFVTIYGTGRSIAALILSALFMRVIFCYHDWVQAVLLFVIYIILFAILFLFIPDLLVTKVKVAIGILV